MDPIWYLVADSAAPKNVGTTWRRGWIEGFVAALEFLSESGNDPTALIVEASNQAQASKGNALT